MKNILLIAALCFIAASCGNQTKVTYNNQPFDNSENERRLDDIEAQLPKFITLAEELSDLEERFGKHDEEVKSLQAQIDAILATFKTVNKICDIEDKFVVIGKKKKRVYINLNAELRYKHDLSLVKSSIVPNYLVDTIFIVVRNEDGKVEYAKQFLIDEKGDIECWDGNKIEDMKFD